MPKQAFNSVLRLHNRQFAIGPEAIYAYNDWCCRQLAPGIWVSSCPHLRTQWATDADGQNWVLFGLAIETLVDRLEPHVEMARHSSAEIPNLYASWAGRWVLIGQSEVHMDASGLLGCFYGTRHERQIWVSSSPALLAHILSPDAALPVDTRKLIYQSGVSWFPPPQSRLAGIRRLLPSQVIELTAGRIRPRPLMPPIDPSRSYDEILELLQHSLVTTLQRLFTEGKQLWLGLSAGGDSRLILAMAYHAGVDVMPFTRLAARVSVADRVLPPKLAREVGYKHIYMRGGKHNPDRQQFSIEQTAGHVSEGDAEPFNQGVRDALEGISLGGQCFGVGKLPERGFLPDTFNNPEIAAEQIARVRAEKLPSNAVAGLREWLEWVLQTPQDHLDWRDRYYIEQRLAGWQSSKEQLYDLSKLERFFPINSARNYALLLSLKEDCRVGAKHQMEMIRRSTPELLKYPCNPGDSYFNPLQAIAVKSADDPLYVLRRVKGKIQQMWSLTR